MIKKIYIVIGIVLIILSIFLAESVKGDSENITITSPRRYEDLSSNFTISLRITDENATSAQAKLISISGFIPLSQDGPTLWNSNILNPESYPEGTYTLTAYYQSPEGEFWVADALRPTVNIHHPPQVIQYGEILIKVIDSRNNNLQDVVVQPSYNKTDSSGNVKVGRLPLNQAVNFNLSRPGYNSTEFNQIFNNNITLQQTIMMSRRGGDLRDMTLTGYKFLEVGRTTIVTVKDTDTGDRIDDVELLIYDGANIKTGPFYTQNGRALISIGPDAIPGNYMIEASKKGYVVWSDDFIIYAPKTTTPKPTQTTVPPLIPITAPTPQERYYADANMKLTAEEYKAWLANKEAQTREANLNNQTPAQIQPPPPKGDFPWLYLLSASIVLGYAGLKGYQKLKPKKEEQQAHVDDDCEKTDDKIEDLVGFEQIICSKCPWSFKVPSDTSKSTKEQILNDHIKYVHEESIPNKKKSEEDPN